MADAGRRGPPQVLTVLAVVAVLGHLYGLYRTTGPPSPSWFPYADKVEHLLGFAVPFWLILQARGAAVSTPRSVGTSRTTTGRTTGPSGLSRRFVLAVTGAFAVNAVLSELAQHYFYRHRTGDPLDTLADLLGIVLGLGLAKASRDRRRLPTTSSGPAEATVPR